jgi:predicted acyltransferase (DUF342 family)
MNTDDIHGEDQTKTRTKGKSVLDFRNDPEFKELSGVFPPNTSILAARSGLINIADNTHVSGEISAGYSTALKSVGSNVRVGGNLTIKGSEALESIGDNVSTAGDLNALQCRNLSRLGENITVGGALNVYGTKISELPSSLKMLDPEAFIYTNWGQFRAQYNLTAVEIANACVNKTPVTAEPAAEDPLFPRRPLKTAQFNDDRTLTQLPDGLSSGFNIKARNSGMTGIKPNSQIEGTLDVTGAQNFRSIGSGTKIGGNLRLEGGTDIDIGDNVDIGGGVLLNKGKNIRFGENVHIRGDLHIVNSNLKSLPASMRVDGRIFSDFGIIESNGVLSAVELAKMVFNKAGTVEKKSPAPVATAAMRV